jgi:alkylation response protein AidB-like acyl-CoA dehydrogenase
MSEMMNGGDEILAMLLDSAGSFLDERHDLARLRISDQLLGSAVDPIVWRQMAELGWLGLGLPEELGGTGLGLACAAALCEHFGRALLPEPFIASALMPGALLAACPASEGRDALAVALSSGTAVLTVAWQERIGQIDVSHFETAVRQQRLSGTKLFVPASLPDMSCLAIAVEAGEPVLVVVPIESPGVGVSARRMGDGGMSATLSFDEAALAGPILARGVRASAALATALDQAQIALAAQLAGLADGALALSLDYLRTRVQFGRSIGTFQALQHRAVDLYAKVEMAKAGWRRAEVLHRSNPTAPATVAAISAAKAMSIRAARDTATAGIQFFGAMGFTEEADIGLYLRSALHWSSWLGNETAHRRRFHENTVGQAAA